MANVVVVGMQWGDEAKGKVVDYLAQDADYVVRYNGGNNAGHTVVIGNEIYKFHTVPVGVLNEGVTAVVTDGVVFDPSVFVAELAALRERGIPADRIRISRNVHIIMPWHRVLDNLEENSKGDKKIGTTGRGIGPAYADKMSRTGIRMAEFIDPDRFRLRLSECIKRVNALITKVYGSDPLDEEAIYAEYSAYAREIEPFVCDTSTLLYEASSECANIVFEGAHGSLLDIDHGTYPFATSSHCVAGGACIGTGIGPTMIDRVIGVAKAYTTRVGAGPFPTELRDAIGDRIREQGNEYGTTTGRPRRCGWFDAVAVKFTAMVNSADAIALISLDVLSGLETVRVCKAYEIDGSVTPLFPSNPYILEKCRPVYEELPGWSDDISGVRKFDDLPENAKNYVEYVSQALGVPVALVSVGRGREQTVMVRPDLLQI